MTESASKEIAILQTKLEGLREVLDTKFGEIEGQLRRIEQDVAKLAVNSIPPSQCERSIKTITRAHERLNDHEKRISDQNYQQQQIVRLSRIIWGIISAVLIAVLVALATGKATVVWQ